VSKFQTRFFSAFAGATLVTAVLMEKLYSYQNILLSIALGLLLAFILVKK
jgi:hypothetical protein